MSIYLSIISLAAIAFVSVFNVGYFWRLGLHFMGVTDLTNIAYSFGQAAVVLFVIFLFVPRLVRYSMAPLEADQISRFLRFRNLIMLIASGVIIFALLGRPKYLPNHVAQDGVMTLGLLIGIYGLLKWHWLRYRVLGKNELAEVGMLGVLIIGAVFNTGLFSASLATVSPETYVITTKSKVLENVRIMRASSIGLVLFVDDAGIYIPQPEIISVKANRTVSDRY
jgi:hypothetical protein